MTDGVIFDRGYRTYDGPRRGPAGARRAVYKEGLKRIFGQGRKARAKIFPGSMMGIALMTAIVTSEDEGGKTRYTARALHWTAEDKKTHEDMGFHVGWGICADQLAALAKKI